MNTVTISHGNPGTTAVSNRFIDEYMKDANDAQVKIYLYLLRTVGANLPSGISDIADYFNYTETDVMRALKYWDKLHVLTLLHDEQKKLTGIRLENLDAQPTTIVSMPTAAVTMIERIIDTTPSAKEKESITDDLHSYDKNQISLDQLKEFKHRDDTSQLLFIIEQYLGRPLAANDIRSIFFMTDILHFSMDLIDYLVQYCVERGKKDFRYMEKVAISWAEANITTPEQAKSQSHKYDKNVYTIMNQLGKNTQPTASEVAFIQKWLKEYAFSMDIISEACKRTVMATDKHRFEYADSILQSWKSASIHTLQDIKCADESFQKRKTNHTKSATVNQFNQFPQRQYDYDELLQKIKIN